MIFMWLSAWGCWETPVDERVKGFSLRGAFKNVPGGQHIENFYSHKLSDEEITDISKGVAEYLNVPLHIDGMLEPTKNKA